MTSLGLPQHFSVDAWLDVVEMYIASDEVELAFKLLDSAPAYYRDHVPERAREIRESLNRQLFTPVQYAQWEGTLPSEADALAQWSLRYQLLEREVKRVCDSGQHPHIMELAPGIGIVQAGLKAKGLDFTYESMSLNGVTSPVDKYRRIVNVPVDRKTIFIAFEIIEHLENPWEIARNYLKFLRPMPDVVMISTPYYTHQACAREWRTAALGHLRTYSPRSLHAVVSEMFEGYQWEIQHDDVQILIGRKT